MDQKAARLALVCKCCPCPAGTDMSVLEGGEPLLTTEFSFVGSGSAFNSGGPASVLICFIIIGIMMLMMMQALGELAVMYPVNGAFYSYIVRFLDPSW
jgi:hypothetical protein